MSDLQPWSNGDRLTVVSPDGENNAVEIGADGCTGKSIAIPDGAEVVVVDCNRVGQYTDVTWNGKRFRMRENRFLAKP